MPEKATLPVDHGWAAAHSTISYRSWHLQVSTLLSNTRKRKYLAPQHLLGYPAIFPGQRDLASPDYLQYREHRLGEGHIRTPCTAQY